MNMSVMRYGMRWTAQIAAVILLLSCVASAAQAVSFGTLEWINRTGTVSGSETIPVQFRLTLDPASVPLTIGPANTGGPISGLEPADLNSLALDFPNYTIQDTYLYHGFACGGTFSSCIDPPPYQFNFSSQWKFHDTSFSPGTPVDLLHGEFVPTPAPAPPGTYFHYSSFVGLSMNGSYIDPQSGNSTPFGRNFVIAQVACDNGDTSCAFQRNVTLAPVPLPGALLLFGVGLAGLAGFGRLKDRMKA